MKIFLKTPAEIEKMHDANKIVCEVLNIVEEHCKPGVSTAELNEIADRSLKRLGGTSAFLGYSVPPYPAVICTSIDDVIVHGIPRKDAVLKEGNIIGIDLVEVAPDYDHSGMTAILAAQILLNTIGRIAHNRS